MNSPTGLTYESGSGRLYVSDGDNSRVLVFDVASITDGENAIDVVGQTTFTSAYANGGPNATGFNGPGVGAVFDTVNHRYFLSDWINSRVNWVPVRLSC